MVLAREGVCHPQNSKFGHICIFCTAWDSPECTNQSEVWHGFPRTCQIWSSLVTGWRGVGMGAPQNYNLERVSYPARFAATWQSFWFLVLTVHLDSWSRLSWPSLSVWDYMNILYTITLFFNCDWTSQVTDNVIPNTLMVFTWILAGSTAAVGTTLLSTETMIVAGALHSASVYWTQWWTAANLSPCSPRTCKHAHHTHCM